MSFTDIVFLITFLPVTLAVFYLIKNRTGKLAVLLLASLLFYACGSPKYLFLLIVTTSVNVLLAWGMERTAEKSIWRRILLVTGIVLNVGLLAYYKYTDFAFGIVNGVLHTELQMRSLVLPLGLSFYTFKAVSYLMDVYRGDIARNDCLTAASYLCFFGQISSGPIARYESFANMAEGFDLDRISAGVVRFTAGFSKKILLANVLSNVVSEIFDKTAVLSTPLAWLGAVCYSLQLYYDFSGYSDMAIGVSGMFGLECPENFNFPYMTKSVAEFWRRWHMTLGSWFREYVYFPLGGSRAGKARLYRNLLVVWLLTGLWHGANWNFIAWGLAYFVVIALEKALNLPNRLRSRTAGNLYRIPVLIFIVLQWVMFRSADIFAGLRYIRVMFVPRMDRAAAIRAAFLLKDYKFFLAAALLLCFPWKARLEEKIRDNRRWFAAYQVLDAGILMVLFAVSICFVVSGQNNPFLYANF